MEKKVEMQVRELGYETYLPLCWVVRQWSDRLKRLEAPLFPSYVFVKSESKASVDLYSVKEFVSLVKFDKRPALVNDKEINMIKSILNEETEVQTESYLQKGTRVRVTAGQFAGMEGVVIKRDNKAHLVVKVDGLMKAFSFSVSQSLLEVID